MTNLLWWLSDIVIHAGVTEQMTEEAAAPFPIGYIVLAIIVGPVVALTVASMLGKPRTYRMPGLFMGTLALLVGVIVLAFAVVGVLLGFIVPE
jgi:hypothetical protein